MKATAKELRFNSKELLNAVERGEEVIITFRGKPTAKLVPYDGNGNNEEKDNLFGIWKDNVSLKSGVDEYVREMRKGRF